MTSKTYAKKLAYQLLNKGYLLPLIFVIIYTAVWSFISLDRFYSFGSYVFDLGINMERSWLIFHTSWNASTLIGAFLYSGIVLIVSPLFIIGGYPFVLIFQSLFLAYTAIPLYYISLRLLQSRLAGWIVSASYLLYFPLAGVNWYDFHYQALFIPLFVTAYALYLRGNLRFSLLLFFLSGITRFPYVIFPLLISIWILYEFLKKAKLEGKGLDKRFREVLLFSILLTMQLLFTYVLLGSSTGLGANLHSSSGGSLLGNFFIDFDTKIETLMLFLFPVLGISLLSRKWTTFLLPGFLLILISTNSAYLFPRTFMMQYGSGIVPFIFLGLIEGTSQVTSGLTLKIPNILSNSATRKYRIRILSTVFVIIILMGAVYLPFGPFNDKTLVNYHLSEELRPNVSLDSQLNNLISLIPANSSSVLVQNNLPQLLPRPTINGTIIVPGLNVANNMTFETATGQWSPVHPQFILEYPFGDYFNYLANPPYNISMYQIITKLYSKYNYGILGEASDMMLLEKGYTGPMKYYVPYTGTYAPHKFNVPSVSHIVVGKLVTNNNITNAFAWYGPYTTLVPGTYNITFSLESSVLEANNSLSLSVAANVGAVILSEKTVNGSKFKRDQEQTNISIRVEIDQLYSSVEFRGWINSWMGNLTLLGVEVQQINSMPLTLNQGKVMNLIPKNASVLTQRVYTPGINSPYVFTPDNFNSDFTYSYILANVNMGQFWPGSGYDSMYPIVREALSSGTYGILAEAAGMILLEKGYRSTPFMFSPDNATFPGTSFSPQAPAFAANDSVYFKDNYASSLWSGPYTTLVPGTYKVTYLLETTNISNENNLTLEVTNDSSSYSLFSYYLKGSNFTSPNTLLGITFTMTANNIESLVEFKAYDAHWSGTLRFEGVILTQVS